MDQRSYSGKSSSRVLDGVGNEVSSTDASGKTSRTFFDADNRPWLSVDVDGHITQSVYDGFSEVVASIDGLGKARRIYGRTYDIEVFKFSNP